MKDKLQKIEDFLETLGEVKKIDDAVDGFYIICKKCGSQNSVKYDDIACGTEMTGCWGDVGIKCLDCGNSAELSSI